MKTHLIYLLITGLLLNVLKSAAQTSPTNAAAFAQKLNGNLTADFKKYPQEKLFIQTDLGNYLSGETIWFKAYTTAYGKPSQISKIAYVRLTDSLGRLIKQTKLPLKNGSAYGNIDLADSLKTGWYQLEAFTAWMLNFEEYGFYRQKVFIRNVRLQPAAQLSAQSTTASAPLSVVKNVANVQNYRVNFYPEGGEMLNGTIANIAFKAMEVNGLPAAISGVVLNGAHKQVAAITTTHDGMGSFTLPSFAGEQYTAQLRLPDNSTQTLALPEVKKTGILLQINDASDTEIEVKIADVAQQNNSQNIIVEAVQGNGLISAYPLTLNRGLNIYSFKKSAFITGILRLTVFNEQNLPSAERLVFINHHGQLNFKTTADSLSFNPKAKNVISINLDRSILQPADLSVAVTDADLSNEPENNIVSYMLMSSELKGDVNNASYYFKNNSDTLQKQLDLVMLTNGWRRFKWTEIMTGQPIALKYQPEQAQFIAGKIDDYKQLKEKKIKLTITNADSTVYFLNVKPDSSGSFFLNPYEKTGAAKILAETVDQKNRQQPLKVSFARNIVTAADVPDDTLLLARSAAPVDMIPQEISRAKAVQFTKMITKGIVLKEVKIKTLKAKQTEEVIARHVRQLTVDVAYDLDLVNLPSLPTMDIIEYMRGRFPGLDIYGTKDSATFFYRGFSSFKDRTNKPYFYIDESRVELEDIVNISLSDVALIRFVPPPVWFAPLQGGPDGAIVIYTKTYGDSRTAPKTNREIFETYTFNGYSISREYSEPDYSKPALKTMADYRQTLYWNPALKPDENGKYTIRFYNSDVAKKYRVIIQGINTDGQLGYSSQVF